MKTVYYISILIVLYSCSTPKYEICEVETQDKELKLYHDVLTELIENHFYNGYLNQVITKDKYPNPTIDFADTAEFNNDLILLQNQLFNDTAKFETICYRPTLQDGPWNYFYSDSTDFITMAKTDSTQRLRDIKTFLTTFS
ncbi:MAG TPA: hypothetical protein VK658_01770 [Chryseolinea sp.]|nr:hypothetical protein [Chryseolinea sp.]